MNHVETTKTQATARQNALLAQNPNENCHSTEFLAKQVLAEIKEVRALINDLTASQSEIDRLLTMLERNGTK